MSGSMAGCRKDDMRPKSSSRPLAWKVVAFLLVAGALGFGVFLVQLGSWSDVRSVSPAEAAVAFDDVLAAIGGGPPYVEIDAAGAVSVHREQEGDQPTPLDTLHLLSWEPGPERLVRIAFPFWFVRLKTTDELNLGTLTAVLVGDWESLALRVSTDDLERRGPALVIDHARADGARILLWTE